MKKIGIFGGTFNPVHAMHIHIAKQAMELMDLDQVIFVPSANPPHKLEIEIIPFFHRFKMVEIAIEGIDGFSVSNIENKINHKKSYTVDTLKALHLIYPEDQLYFIVGSDCIFEIENWHQPAEIFKYCELITFQRPDVCKKQKLNQKIKFLESKFNGKISCIGELTEAISSTMIRDRIKKRQYKELLNEKVMKYIECQGLYR